MVESVQTEHLGNHCRYDELSSPGTDGRRYIAMANPRKQMTRVHITGLIQPPEFVELPFIKRDRFTLAALLPKIEDEERYDDIPDWE